MSLVVKPFKATYYNPSFIKNYSSVICPPYDVISKEQLALLRKKSPYNFSKVLIADNNNYQGSGNLLRQWLSSKILIEDKKDCLYLYEQKFNIDGKNFNRFGIVSLLKMDKGGIFPHEHTLKAPKEDRKKIIKTTKANLSPIFVIAAKSLKSFKRIHRLYSRRKPFLRFKDDDGNDNIIWQIDDKKDINLICSQISKCKLVIADGHHRFEISYDYFRKNKDRFKDLNYILAYITDCQKGLSILPTHRIIKIHDKDNDFFRKLEKYFNITEVTQNSLSKKLKYARRFCMGIYRKEKFYFLKLKSSAILDKIPNRLYRELDTYVFHKLVLPLFTIDEEFEYSHNIKTAKKIAGKGKTAFIMRKVPLKVVLTMSSKGFRLPQKSTYFYPKVLSGGIIRRFTR